MTQDALAYFVYALGILLREGLETILVVVALAAGARQVGNRRAAREVYWGAGLAVAASLLMAWLVNHLVGDNAGDALEGALQLCAAATLFYVSSWLTAKSQAERWRAFLKARVEGLQHAPGPSAALALTAFVAVMREGGETIIFFQALLAGTTERIETHAVAAGIIAATLILAVVFFTLRSTLLRIPLRLFFGVTSALLYVMAVIFVGDGIASLQEAQVLGARFVEHVPTIKALGIFPTVQTLTAQAVLAAFALMAIATPPLWARRGRPRRDTSSAQPAGARANRGVAAKG